MLTINTQHAASPPLQAHSALETRPASRLILRYTRLCPTAPQQFADNGGESMTVEIEGVTLHLAHPDEVAVEWVGQDELMRQLLAAWMVVNDQDLARSEEH